MSLRSEHLAIFRSIRAIPHGCVAAYGDVAMHAGLPGRARLVGRVLREAGAAVALPWHRVVRADGSIAFPKGSTQHAEQCRRLVSEGVALRAGRVPPEAFAWRNVDLDRSIWGPG